VAKSDPVQSSLAKAAKGLMFVSETDAELEPFVWDVDGKLDEDGLRKQVDAGEDSPVEETTLDRFFRAVPSSQKKKFDALAKTLKDNLSDLRVYKVGEVEMDVYIVGKTNDGRWAGLKTQVVET